MTVIKKLESKQNNRNSLHYKALIEGLDNEPWNYEWTGKVNDSLGSSCVCGHPIRFEYILRHKKTGKIVIVGSVCVVNYQVLDEKTTKAIKDKAKEIQKELNRKKTEAKKNIQKKEIQDLIKERKPLIEKLNMIWNKYREADEFIPWDIYSFSSVEPEKYVRLSSCIKALKKDISILNIKIKRFMGEQEKKLSILIEEKKERERINRIEREKEEKRIANLKWIGEIGENYNFKDVKLVDKYFNNYYDSMFYKFEDEEGNIICKWGSIKVDFVLGGIYSFTAKIKKHSEWEKEKSTTITYLKNIECIENT